MVATAPCRNLMVVKRNVKDCKAVGVCVLDPFDDA